MLNNNTSTSVVSFSNINGSIQEEIKKRILVLDGAMGTMLQRYKFE